MLPFVFLNGDLGGTFILQGQRRTQTKDRIQNTPKGWARGRFRVGLDLVSSRLGVRRSAAAAGKLRPYKICDLGRLVQRRLEGAVDKIGVRPIKEQVGQRGRVSGNSKCGEARGPNEACAG